MYEHLDVLLELMGRQVDFVIAIFVVHIYENLQRLHNCVKLLAYRHEADTVIKVAVLSNILPLDNLECFVRAAEHFNALKTCLEENPIQSVYKAGD